MKGYPLGRLLALREHREKKARAEVGRRRRLLAEAEAEAKQAELTAKEYAERRPQEEAALFARIRNQVLERKQLDSYHEAIAALAEKELELFEKAEEAWKAVRQCEEELKQAVQEHAATVREVQKFEEHRTIWWREEKKRREDVQELEAEEAATSAAVRRAK
ncbi:type III secretion protein [Desulfovibrio sp. OttesenSCG-928-F20]|nr:type III secretion protein [Desulfovibrio sp. OttesenSCG-928-F20]